MKVISFIPVRGGSKSIPLKNIKLFCGKPLVCWNIEALENTPEVDEIIVATDSDEIENTVKSCCYRKTKIYRRSSENAADTSSTESVMLEYINAVQMSDDDVFMLVQATSPLTSSADFEGGIKLFFQGDYDSVLTCVRNYRFFWNEDGTSNNYDYKNRPRRQNFAGRLMENGAFYINTVKNIKASNNRLSGKIGIYEMPEYTALEIDEPDDWILLETMMRRHILSKVPQNEALCGIKMVLSDVDGTLTDAGMYYSEKGDELKKFNTRDGMGFSLLRQKGIVTGIITSENVELNKRRAEKLKLEILEQGCKDKLSVIKRICQERNIPIQNVCYVGDDINDIEAIKAVGYGCCPADAQQDVKSIANYVTKAKGGEGVIREIVQKILR